MTYLPSNSPLYMGVIGVDRLLAESPAFRRRVGAATAEQARARIEAVECELEPAEMKARRPVAIVWPEDLDFVATGGGVRQEFTGGGRVCVLLADNARYPGNDAANRRKSALDFLGWVGDVIADLMAHAGEDDRLLIRQIRMRERDGDGPYRSPTKDERTAGAFWWARVHIYWGEEV
jgi:hypothetical protein